MTNRSELAVSKFTEGFNCAQSVLYSFSDHLQLDKKMALKLASGFGGGMGRKGEVCGAVTGGIIAIGTKYGSSDKNDFESKETSYKKTKELMDSFKKKQGTYLCRKLLDGCELTNKEGQKQFKKKDLKNKICIPCVKNAVEILESIVGY